LHYLTTPISLDIGIHDIRSRLLPESAITMWIMGLQAVGLERSFKEAQLHPSLSGHFTP
jgi:hypothetical protein